MTVPNNYLGQPAYSMLGYGGSAGLGPNRSKAFSMQADLPTVENLSEEKSPFES